MIGIYFDLLRLIVELQKKMGNLQCCAKDQKSEVGILSQVERKKKAESEIKIQINQEKHQSAAPPPTYLQPIAPPELTEEAEKQLKKFSQLYQETPGKTHYKRFGDQLFVGELDMENQYPEGRGKMYKCDGSVYIGEWKLGKAHGHGVYIIKDGSYYEGNFHHNSADGEGKYVWGTFEYVGNFIGNKFQGKGAEKDYDHSFVGEYYEGHKKEGRLTWRQDGFDFEYNGKFNKNNQFDGQGILKEPKGVYEGHFLNGEKHGKGSYRYTGGWRYEGDYLFGIKQGSGTLYLPNKTMAYRGSFQEGVPHGKGYVLDANGGEVQRKYLHGVEQQVN